ncbi:MAG: type III restriction endonuclease subunit M, partial [Selenomonas sp.]|nr:type III restriction endonuclease subunit M [Selenomonas sp.]
FNVADGFLLACFDRDVTDEVVTAIAQRRPYYAVFRDASMADDSALTNFDQLFAAYSPATVRRVL